MLFHFLWKAGFSLSMTSGLTLIFSLLGILFFWIALLKESRWLLAWSIMSLSVFSRKFSSACSFPWWSVWRWSPLIWLAFWILWLLVVLCIVLVVVELQIHSSNQSGHHCLWLFWGWSCWMAVFVIHHCCWWRCQTIAYRWTYQWKGCCHLSWKMICETILLIVLPDWSWLFLLWLVIVFLHTFFSLVRSTSHVRICDVMLPFITRVWIGKYVSMVILPKRLLMFLSESGDALGIKAYR